MWLINFPNVNLTIFAVCVFCDLYALLFDQQSILLFFTRNYSVDTSIMPLSSALFSVHHVHAADATTKSNICSFSHTATKHRAARVSSELSRHLHSGTVFRRRDDRL